MDTELTHVRHDPAHCLVPGLFRSLPKGARSRDKLDVSYTRNGYNLRFMGAEPLGADDLRFLQVIVAFAGRDGVMLTQDASDEEPVKLRSALLFSPESKVLKALKVTFKTRKLLRELDMTIGGSNLKSLKASLTRMSSVTVIVESLQKNGFCTESYHLLSFCAKGSMSNVSIALNPYLASAILGEHPYTRIELSEIRALKMDAACLIHQRLCGQVDPGKSQKIGMKMLITYVWRSDEASSNTICKRRKRILKSFEQLRGIGWIVEEYRRDSFEFKRPRNYGSSSSKSSI